MVWSYDNRQKELTATDIIKNNKEADIHYTKMVQDAFAPVLEHVFGRCRRIIENTKLHR